MIHPHTELRPVSPTIGLGIFATKLIPRGTVTWVQDTLDIELTAEQFHALPEPQRVLVHHYSYLDSRGLYVLCWDSGRYMNHSCSATTISYGTICDVALRDIQPGEELTCDYVLLNLEHRLTCHCGSPTCRGEVAPGDFEKVGHLLDQAIQDVTPFLSRVEQPLAAMMLPPERARLEAVMKGSAAPLCTENRAPASPRRG